MLRPAVAAANCAVAWTRWRLDNGRRRMIDAKIRQSTPKRDQFPQSARLRGGRQRRSANSVIAAKDNRFRSRSKPGAKTRAASGRGRILSGIGENPGKTSFFARISKNSRGHYD